MLAALNTNGITKIKAKKSRDHTELMLKSLNLPISIIKKKNFDLISIKGRKNFKPINYKIPSDISSSAFFIVLTVLSNNSKITIKNVNINPSRTGLLEILKKMGAKIKLKNRKIYKGEKTSDIYVEGGKILKPINCSPTLNSSCIDEFLLIFLLAAKARGISHFKKLSELNQKESPRLLWGSKILTFMGVKNKTSKNSIKIYGNPNLTINKNINIKNFMKDHRVFMTSVIAALAFGGNWTIYDKASIKTSFPSFLLKIKSLGAKFT